MNDINVKTHENFDHISGVLYSTVAMLSIDPQNKDKNISKLLWLLLSEAIARIKETEQVLPWFCHQLNSIYMLDQEIKDYFGDYLNQYVNISIPILLFTKGKKREELWKSFNEDYSTTQKEKKAIRKLLYLLLSEQPEYLFTNDYRRYDLTNPVYFTSPDMCVIAKLGQTIKFLKENYAGEFVELFEEWKDILGNQVLKVLPDKISPGFAKESPLFESLVFSLLHTAALLTQKDISSVKEYMKDSISNPSDAITVDQIILIAALYGLVTKYDKNSSWINEIEQRRLLSSQALLLSLSLDPSYNLDLPGIDPVVFYSTKSGKSLEFCYPYLEVLKREYKEMQNYSKGTCHKSWKYQVCIGGAFQIWFNHESS